MSQVQCEWPLVSRLTSEEFTVKQSDRDFLAKGNASIINPESAEGFSFL